MTFLSTMSMVVDRFSGHVCAERGGVVMTRLCTYVGIYPASGHRSSIFRATTANNSSIVIGRLLGNIYAVHQCALSTLYMPCWYSFWVSISPPILQISLL